MSASLFGKICKSDEKHLKFSALLMDLLVSMFASLLAILFVRWITEPIFDFGRHVYLWVLIAFGTSLLSFVSFGTNNIVIKPSTHFSLGKLINASLVKEILLVVVMVCGGFRFGEILRSNILLVVTDTLITVVMIVLTRVLIRAIYEDQHNTPGNFVNRMPVMVYGISDESVSMVLRLENSQHYAVLGFLTRDRMKGGLTAQNKKSYLFENEADLEHLKMNLGFSCILFAREEDAALESGEDGLITMSFSHGIQCLTAPKINQVDLGLLPYNVVKEVMQGPVDFIPDGMSGFERNTKRLIDFCLSSVLLVVFCPLFLICYCILKLDDGGPAIFKQERIGRFGRPFYIYKFRSMRVDAEANGPALYAGDKDPRLTRVGGFLRRHHLDELPQLWNVFKGDMAFVGHRPERKFYIDQIMAQDPRYYFLYQIRPGVTSYSTLKVGYTDTMEKMLRRLEFDLYYLRHRSWWLDIKVLWRTFTNIVFGKVF